MSNKNRIKLSFFPALRGAILDRNNQKVAYTKPFYNLILDKQGINNLSNIINLLHQQNLEIPQKVLENIKKIKSPTSDILLLKRISWERIKPIEANKILFPHLYIEENFERAYPANTSTFHLTGYVINEIKNKTKISVGKAGIEKIYNDELTGKAGYHELEVNSLGKVIREMKTSPAVKGRNLQASIDVRIANIIDKLLVDKIGAVIILNANTGEVLAMNSNPYCDANKFVVGYDEAAWQSIVNDPNKPFLNRCISSQYPAGSPFKLVTALAGLENNIDPNKHYFCGGSHKVGRREFKCNKKEGHGLLKMEEAIARSCNVYFYKIAEKVGINNMHKAALKLGLGQKTNIELENEKSGNIPNKAWKMENFHEDWMLGDTANASIGQGFILVTPIQLALMTAQIATGKKISPTVLYKPQYAQEKLNIADRHLDILRRGMQYSVSKPWGGARYAKLKSKNAIMAGKTGTAQVVGLDSNKGIEDHAIFTGFVKTSTETYSISVLAEHKSWGSRNAAPIARNIFNQLLDEKII